MRKVASMIWSIGSGVLIFDNRYVIAEMNIWKNLWKFFFVHIELDNTISQKSVRKSC